MRKEEVSNRQAVSRIRSEATIRAWTDQRSIITFALITRNARGTAMLAYISFGIGLFNILVGFVFFLTWAELRERIKNSPTLQEDFQATVRRLMISIGCFGLPILKYLFAGNKRSPKIPEAYALAWGIGCALSLLILIEGLIILIRHTDRENKISLHKYRR